LPTVDRLNLKLDTKEAFSKESRLLVTPPPSLGGGWGAVDLSAHSYLDSPVLKFKQ